MEFTPKTDEELAREGLLPDGIYPAEIIDIEERDDSKGRPFFMVKLGVYDDDHESHVYDNVSTHWMHFKFKHLYESAGKLAEYEKGKTGPADMLHWQLTVLLGSENSREYTDRNTGEKKTSPPKNVVKDYLMPDARPTQAVKTADLVAAAAEDSDLPWETKK